MSDKADKPKVRIHDDPSVREVFASKLISTFFDGGALVITLGAHRVLVDKTHTPPNTPAIYTTARLALTPEAANELINGLNSLASAISRPTDPLKSN